MQMGDYRLIIWLVLTCTEKSRNYWNWIGGAFAKIMHGFGCQILACDPEENKESANRYNLHTFEEV
jgi:D-lactate dehydrogenase